MERLTKRDTDGQAMMDCEKCKADWTGKHGKPMVDCTALYCRNRLKARLAAYEDTGLTPGEVKSMQEEHFSGLEMAKLHSALMELKKYQEADKEGRLVVLPFTSGRTLLSKENINSPRLMKDVQLAIRYCSSCGIVFHMGYNVFCNLVKHGRITAVSEETEKALGAMKDE